MRPPRKDHPSKAKGKEVEPRPIRLVRSSSSSSSSTSRSGASSESLSSSESTDSSGSTPSIFESLVPSEVDDRRQLNIREREKKLIKKERLKTKHLAKQKSEPLYFADFGDDVDEIAHGVDLAESEDDANELADSDLADGVPVAEYGVNVDDHADAVLGAESSVNVDDHPDGVPVAESGVNVDDHADGVLGAESVVNVDDHTNGVPVAEYGVNVDEDADRVLGAESGQSADANGQVNAN